VRHIEITKNPQWHPSQKDDAISKKFVFTDTATGHDLTGVCGYTIYGNDATPVSVGINGRPEFKTQAVDLLFEDGRTENCIFTIKL